MKLLDLVIFDTKNVFLPRGNYANISYAKKSKFKGNL